VYLLMHLRVGVVFARLRTVQDHCNCANTEAGSEWRSSFYGIKSNINNILH
jgi:hypothetical protein